MNELAIRGEETMQGQAGFCPRCRRSMPDGSDVCLGDLPDVSHACCGHGVTRRAYVVLGGAPNQDTSTIPNPEILRGELALRYFGIEPFDLPERVECLLTLDAAKEAARLSA